MSRFVFRLIKGKSHTIDCFVGKLFHAISFPLQYMLLWPDRANCHLYNLCNSTPLSNALSTTLSSNWAHFYICIIWSRVAEIEIEKCTRNRPGWNAFPIFLPHLIIYMHINGWHQFENSVMWALRGISQKFRAMQKLAKVHRAIVYSNEIASSERNHVFVSALPFVMRLRNQQMPFLLSHSHWIYVYANFLLNNVEKNSKRSLFSLHKSHVFLFFFASSIVQPCAENCDNKKRQLLSTESDTVSIKKRPAAHIFV